MNATDAPIYRLMNPMPSVRLLESDDPKYKLWKRIHRVGDSAALRDIHMAMEREMTAQGRFIPQPEHTIERLIHTKAELSVGSIRLQVKKDKQFAHDDTDYAHMNGDYGATMLRRLLQAFTPPVGDKNETAISAAA